MVMILQITIWFVIMFINGGDMKRIIIIVLFLMLIACTKIENEIVEVNSDVISEIDRSDSSNVQEMRKT